MILANIPVIIVAIFSILMLCALFVWLTGLVCIAICQHWKDVLNEKPEDSDREEDTQR